MHLVALQRGWYRAISMSCVTLPKWHEARKCEKRRIYAPID
jgi:hypothetical protein